MKVTAIVMAGGKGSRMTISEEKPLLKIGGKPAVLHVLDALKNANKVDNALIFTQDIFETSVKIPGQTTNSLN